MQIVYNVPKGVSRTYWIYLFMYEFHQFLACHAVPSKGREGERARIRVGTQNVNLNSNAWWDCRRQQLIEEKKTESEMS